MPALRKAPPCPAARQASPDRSRFNERMTTAHSRTSSAGRELTLRPRCMRVSVAGAAYGLPLSEVQEVIGLRPITRVFHAPAALSGIMNLRGEVLPIIELSVLLGAGTDAVHNNETRIVVVRESSGARRWAGVKVDALLGLLELPESGLLPVPSSITPQAGEFLAGVIASTPPCSILDVNALLSAPVLAELSGASRA
jgi:purine-binding chemotaxis protein CheW